MSGQSVTAVITGGHRRISPSAAPGAQSVVLVSAASPGVESYSAATTAGLALLDDADASAQRTTLGLAIGTDVQAYDTDLAAIANNSTNGLLARTGDGTAAARTITGTSNQVTVTNGDGVSGNPTLSLPQSIHTGASPTFTGLDLTGLTDNTLVRIGSSGLADSSIRETTSYPSLSATVGLVARVPSNGISVAPVINDVLKLGGTSHTATLSGQEPAIAGFNHYGGSFGGGWIVRTRLDNSDTQIDNTKFCANGGLELVHCSTDPTGVAGKSQIWPRNSDGAWMIREGTGTERRIAPLIHLAATTTYYVRSDGSDSNNGLANTSGGAFATISGAFTYLSRNVNAAGYTITIQCGAGTYTGNVLPLPIIGCVRCVVIGDQATPANCLISTTSANAFTVAGLGPMRLKIAGFEVRTTTSGDGIAVTQSRVEIGAVRFGACVGSHIFVEAGGYVEPTASYTISGGANSHIYFRNGGFFNNELTGSYTVTLSGTPAFGNSFVRCQHGRSVIVNTVTWSGSATGVRYIADQKGVIETGNQATTWLPGNSAGSETEDGLYT